VPSPDTKPLILIVDDDLDAAFLIRRLLSKSEVPHDCLHLGDGEKAIDYLVSSGAPDSKISRPAAMLLDIKMPKVGGFDVLEWMRSSPRYAVPVMVLTTSDDPRDKERAEFFGADAFAAKFPPVEEFREHLEKLLGPRTTVG